MTYQEVIDNIQTRIETIIANRFTDTYTITTISASDYNPDIDDSITVTITLTDQTGDPITNQSVPLYVDNNSISGLTTDNNGQCTYTYTCSDWGTHTFTVNGKTIQIQVKGWKQVNTGTVYTIYENQTDYRVVINGEVTFSSQSWASWQTIPSTYAPPAHMELACSERVVKGRLTTTGQIQLINSSTSSVTTRVSGVCTFTK